MREKIFEKKKCESATIAREKGEKKKKIMLKERERKEEIVEKGHLDVLLSHKLPEGRDGALQWMLRDDEPLPIVETWTKYLYLFFLLFVRVYFGAGRSWNPSGSGNLEFCFDIFCFSSFLVCVRVCVFCGHILCGLSAAFLSCATAEAWHTS